MAWRVKHLSVCNAGDLGLIPGLGRSSGEGNGNPLQYSLAWKMPQMREAARLQSMILQSHAQLSNFTSYYVIITTKVINISITSKCSLVSLYAPSWNCVIKNPPSKKARCMISTLVIFSLCHTACYMIFVKLYWRTWRKNGSPFQCSFLENPMDREAWQATLSRVAGAGHDLATKSPPPPPPHWRANFK